MKKYIGILGFMVIMGCSGGEHKNSKFYCLTAFGTGQIEPSTPGFVLTKNNLTIDDSEQTVIIPRSSCVEIIEKQ